MRKENEDMRVLWLCNMVPGRVIGEHGKGLWMDHVLDGMLRLGVTVHVLGRGPKAASGTPEEGLSYTAFEEPVPYLYYPELEQQFGAELKDFQPDVIHIWGTEYGHTLAMMKACESLNLLDRAVISIQGLCSFVTRHHNEGFPQSIIHKFSLRDLIRRENLALQAQVYAKRGKLELEALAMARHVIGRTEWDRACTQQVSPNAQYHFCNETMRENFYTGTWSYDNCCKHRIFAPNWTDPSKGFHNLLEAFPEILRHYPDATIWVTGKSCYPATWKDRLRIRAHHKYLIDLIEKNGLKDKIHFTGRLSAEEMKQAFLNANVFVLPSPVENSPNTVCESMLLGVPCVSTAVGGLMHMLRHGEEGFLYQSTAPYMLAYYVKRVFEMGKDAEKLGLAAQAHARKTHDSEHNLNTLVAIYKTVGGKE